MDTTYIYTLSLHDALPISLLLPEGSVAKAKDLAGWPEPRAIRSEEHTSELQSRFDLVCRLLLEKKKNGRVLYSLPPHTRPLRLPLDIPFCLVFQSSPYSSA